MSGTTEPTLPTTDGFTDRVMTAIALVPAPTPTRTFVAALRARAVRDAVAALWVAWHLVTVRSWHVAPRVRARSFALVLAVTSVLATGGLAAAAAVHSVVPQDDDRVPVSAPSGSSVDQGPAGNGQTATDETDETNESPTTSDEPDTTDHGDSGATVDSSYGAGDGQHTTRGAQPDEADDDGDHHDPDEADDHDGDEPDEADDGPDGDDAPAATDDHSGSDGGEAPDSSGSSDSAGEPDGSGAETGGD